MQNFKPNGNLILDDPEVRAYLEKFERDVLPMMRDSALHITILPKEEHVDPKVCLELGASLLLGKPLILCLRAGARLPIKLALVADAVVEWKEDDREYSFRELRAAIKRLKPSE